MKITFNTIKLHHFLSFGDAEISLENKGFCLVTGVNKNPKDAAKSNGSGKSTIWNAICWSLTGETAQGLHSNLPNILYGDGCWVELNFKVNSDDYKIIRYREDVKRGSDLKIYINDVDKSGKGLRESEAVLAQYLPELSGELIGSVIILGQGLPYKFSGNTPVGRKEILEKLSKSDFMIEDLKDRVSKRNDVLSKNLRTAEDSLLTLATQKSIYERQIIDLESDIKRLDVQIDFDGEIKTRYNKCALLDVSIVDIKAQIDQLNQEIQLINDATLHLSSEKFITLNKINTEHAGISKEYSSVENTCMSEIRVLSSDITRLKNITDVCPTCGQKLPGVLKPDTTEKENKLKEYKAQLAVLEDNILADNKEYNEVINRVSSEYDIKITESKNKLVPLNAQIRPLMQDESNKEREKSNLLAEIAGLEKDKANHLNNQLTAKNKLAKAKEDLELNIVNTGARLKDKDNITEHCGVVNSINTLIKRDFRGFLLTGVIDFLNKKARDYCTRVFETDDLRLVLSGTNLDILFCNKIYENLSGGEKQKVDLILQFAIRDMMCQYLNFSSNILVLDEITDNLDSVGCERILNLISKELSDVESIFIISHHGSELSIPYDNEIVVEKNEEGISKIR